MKFDYKGYSEEKLKSLSIEERKVAYVPFANKYLGSEFYSMGILIRKFAYFPSFLPFRICYDHGYSPYKEVFDDQKENCDTRFVFQKWREELYKPYYKKVRTILFPYIFYRKYKKIKQVKNPKGTLIFAGHDYGGEYASNQAIPSPSIEEIKSLPEEYQPACVCLHVLDIKNGIYKKYLEAGIPVYTAGHAQDIRFVKRFYDVLKNFKYSMSHTVGSNTICSVDLGIPVRLFKREDINPAKNDFANLFTKVIDKPPIITDEQISYINSQTGINDSISRFECAKIVWGSFFKYICTKEAWKGFGKLLKNLTNRRFYKNVVECIRL